MNHVGPIIFCTWSSSVISKDNEANNIVQGATCVPSAKNVTTFTWNIKLYRVKRSLLVNVGLKIKYKMKLTVLTSNK